MYFLGTAGALPTTNKNPACFMVRRGSDTLLFDCGEGAQQQMMRARTGFTVDAVFISHWHADHYLGICGLVQTMSFNGREDPLMVYGPSWIYEFIDYVEKISKTRLNFRIIPSELRHGSVVPFDGYTVRAYSSDHGMPGLGYILEEDMRPGKFDREKAIELGVKPGPLFGRLQRGENVEAELPDGEIRVIRPEDVMGPARPGRKVVYSGDTRPQTDGEWIKWARDADLLIHDATYDDSERKRAAEVFHSTAGEAAEVAEAISARMLALVHISSRYTKTTTHIQDAEKYYGGTIISPEDLDMIELPFR